MAEALERVPRKPQQRLAAVSSEPSGDLFDPSKNYLKLGDDLSEMLPLVAASWSEEYVLRRLLHLQQRQDGIRRARGQNPTGWTRPVRLDVAKPLADHDYWRWPARWEERQLHYAVQKLVDRKAITALPRKQALEGWTDEDGTKHPPVLTEGEAGQGKVYCYRCLVENWAGIAEESERVILEQRAAAKARAEEEEGPEDDAAATTYGDRPEVLAITEAVRFVPGKKAPVITLPRDIRKEVGFDKVRIQLEGQPATVGLTLRKNILDCTVQVENPHSTADSHHATSNGNGKNPHSTADSHLGRWELRLAQVAQVTLPPQKLRESYAHIEAAVKGGLDRVAIEEFACTEVLRVARLKTALRKPFSPGLVPIVVAEAPGRFRLLQAPAPNGNAKAEETTLDQMVDEYVQMRDGGGS